MNNRRFPPPWSVEEHNDACFIVRDFPQIDLAPTPKRRGFFESIAA